ncbi:MAG: type II toxin-antitoxin system RelE/ParE family toxin [Candidatus Gracilibacteria bacterium]|nr:type II toxin-antitoxin system RelE/ParE family toxin [Candidatus Gracilibacteria bacterium]
MFNVEFSNEANLEYISIGEYIAKDNLFFANEVLNRIDSSIETILMFPMIGKEIDKGIRMIVEPIYKYKIVYEVRIDTIYVLSIFKYKNTW